MSHSNLFFSAQVQMTHAANSKVPTPRMSRLTTESDSPEVYSPDRSNEKADYTRQKGGPSSPLSLTTAKSGLDEEQQQQAKRDLQTSYQEELNQQRANSNELKRTEVHSGDFMTNSTSGVSRPF